MPHLMIATFGQTLSHCNAHCGRSRVNLFEYLKTIQLACPWRYAGGLREIHSGIHDAALDTVICLHIRLFTWPCFSFDRLERDDMLIMLRLRESRLAQDDVEVGRT